MNITEYDKLAKHLLAGKKIEEYIGKYIASNLENKQGYESIISIKNSLNELNQIIPELTESFDIVGDNLLIYDLIEKHDGDLYVLYMIKNWRHN